MHPINQKNFGPNGIAIYYGDGNGNNVTGYIQKQVGTYSYIVTPDGTTLYRASLVPALTDSQILDLGQMTAIIQGPNGIEFIKRLYGTQAVTVSGNTYEWSVDTSVDGSCVINSYASLMDN